MCDKNLGADQKLSLILPRVRFYLSENIYKITCDTGMTCIITIQNEVSSLEGAISGVASGDRTHVCRNHNPMR